MKSLLFAGFCNRLNQMVYSLLNGEGRAVWANNKHLPVRFSTLFQPIEGLDVVEGNFAYPPHNEDPKSGALFFWYLPKRTNSSPLEIKNAFQKVVSSLVHRSDVEPKPLIHHRKYHRNNRVSISDFVEKVVTWAQANFVNSFNGVADGDQEEIELQLLQKGVSVNWLCKPMKSDLDRTDVQDAINYAKAVQASGDSPAVLTSFYGSTFIDFAMACGVPIINCGEGRKRENCRLTELNRILPPIRVISLPDKPERREQFRRNTDKGGLVYRWQEAIVGADLPLPSWAYLNSGVYGCLYSHAEVFREAKRNGWDQISVFEDDAVAVASFSSLEQELIAVPPDIDLIYLRKRRPGRLGTWAYVARARVIQLALDRLGAEPCPVGGLAHIDQWFLRLEKAGRIKAHYLSRDLVFHPVRNASESTIPWFSHSHPKTKPLEVVVVSPGGMGATYMIDLLRKKGLRINSRDDRDRLKHSPPHFHHKQKVIFVWNDPLKAILSLKRRGFLAAQYRKLVGSKFNSSLEEILVDREDPLGIVSYALAWARHPSAFFLDMRNPDSAGLRTFLGRTDVELEIRERKIQNVDLPIEIQESFTALDKKVVAIFKANA